MSFATRISKPLLLSRVKGNISRGSRRALPLLGRLLLTGIGLASICVHSIEGQLDIKSFIPGIPAMAAAGGLDMPALSKLLGAEVGPQRSSSPETLDIIKARGFIGEFYLTRSLDGKAPLAIYHIVNPLADQKTLNRYPVLVVHGVTTDSSSMVANSEKQRPRRPVPGQVIVEESDTSLALTLASNNFDVWLADARGTNMNNHLMSQEIDPAESQHFWNFTLDHQILYDVPAMIEFVLAQTHSNRLHYISYSESTYFMFGLLSRSPEYQSKLISFTALAPVAFVNNIKGITLTIFSLSDFIPEEINGNFLPQIFSDTLGFSIRKLCDQPVFTSSICRMLFTSIAGAGDHEHAREFYAALLKGTSVKSVRQFLQNSRQKRFGMYDYGAIMNMRHYGQETPPNYPLENIKMPGIILFRGTNDFLSDPLDQELLLKHLGTRPYRDFDLPNYNHFDFLTSTHIVKDVNEPATKLIFELTQTAATQEGSASILKDPKLAILPAPFKPKVVVQPDGSREVKFENQLVNNLVNGVLQTETINGQKPAAAAAAAVGGVGQLPILSTFQAALQPLAGLAG